MITPENTHTWTLLSSGFLISKSLNSLSGLFVFTTRIFAVGVGPPGPPRRARTDIRKNEGFFRIVQRKMNVGFLSIFSRSRKLIPRPRKNTNKCKTHFPLRNPGKPVILSVLPSGLYPIMKRIYIERASMALEMSHIIELTEELLLRLAVLI